jgi:hypothetical protein
MQWQWACGLDVVQETDVGILALWLHTWQLHTTKLKIVHGAQAME